MDSGDSGSLQSSSGGDEEYDSRAAAVDSVSTLMSGSPTSNPTSPFLDPLSNYLQLHPNPAWPRIAAIQSDANPVTRDILSPNISMLPSSSPFMPSFHPPPATSTILRPPPQNESQTAARNPKKRSRASRRAPTTVLTTDTTNFRAMVQEFTGIPAPPFDNPSFPRTRFDLFGSRCAASYEASLPYLRHPFAQKVQPPLSFLAPTSAIGASSSSNTTTNNNNITCVISSNTITDSSSNPAINYQLPVTQSPSNSFQNPFLTNFLQTNPRFPLSDSMASKPGLFPHTEFGLSHGDNDFIRPDLQDDRNSNTGKDKDDREDNLRSIASNSKTIFHHDGAKMPEKNAVGEGMVESWIYSSE